VEGKAATKTRGKGETGLKRGENQEGHIRNSSGASKPACGNGLTVLQGRKKKVEKTTPKKS